MPFTPPSGGSRRGERAAFFQSSQAAKQLQPPKTQNFDGHPLCRVTELAEVVHTWYTSVMSVPSVVTKLIEESVVLARAGEISAAFQRAREALEEARASGEAEAIAAALACVAHVRFRLGHYDQARSLAEEAVGHAPSESPVRADALLMLGLCYAETDDPAAAETVYHQAIDLSRQLGYHRALLRALHNLSAGVYIPRGQFDLALAADKEALYLAKEQDLPEIAWAPLASMGWVHWGTGQREQAYAVAEELRGLAPPGSLAKGFYHCLRADLAQDEEDSESALDLYARARSIAEAIGDPGLNVLLRLGLSRYQRAAGNTSAAHDWAHDALTIATRVGYHHLQGMALIERGRAAWEIGEIDAAEADFRAAMDTLTPLQANFDLARAALLLAALYHQQGHTDAKAIWRDAAERIVNSGYAFLLEQERPLAFPLVAAFLNDADPAIAALSTTILTHLERVPPPPLNVLTLGRFEVRQGRRSIPARAWRRRRAGELFRLLLLSPGHSLFRDQIIEAFWPDKSPASAQALFHRATSALRRTLEPDIPDKFPSRYVQVEGGRITLHLPSGSTVDFEAFDEHVRNEEWEAALDLYWGELFPGDRYADWAAQPREWLGQGAIRAAVAMARQHLEAGHPHQALEFCRRALTLEPWQEEAVLLGMRACIALNDRAGALRLYLEMERRLEEELGIAPQAELQQFYREQLAVSS